MATRLASIKQLLSTTSAKDVESLELYREAFEICKRLGKDQAAAKCQEQIVKLERYFASTTTVDERGAKVSDKENKVNKEGKGPQDDEDVVAVGLPCVPKQTSITDWAIKKPASSSSSSFSGDRKNSLSSTLALLTKYDKLLAIKKSRKTQESKWPDLPIELIFMIAKDLTLFDLYKVSLSCADFKAKLQNTPSLWTCLDWGHYARKFRNEHLELLYKLTRGECKSFTLKNASHITSSCLVSISRQGKLMPKALKEFTIHANSKITGLAFAQFLSNKSLKTSLTKVSFVQAGGLDDQGVRIMLSTLENVVEWNFSECHRLTDACISNLSIPVRFVTPETAF